MENIHKTDSGNKSWRNWLLISLAFYGLMLSIVFVYLSKNLYDKLEAKEILLRNEQANQSSCVYKRDSLVQEVNQLSVYKSLTRAMAHRDGATSLLSHKVGDVVRIKRDSSRCVISDIIIGGSQYQYYVKYKVLYGDSHSEEIAPELVY